MSKDPIANLAEHQQWLAPYESPAQEAIRDAFNIFGEARKPVRNALHGTWLHEPLHAILVSVPLGAWTGTAVFDGLAACGAGKTMDTAADATLILGLVGALGAAITGLNDWADVDGPPRRIGAVHALLNITSMALYGASWLRRRSSKAGSRSTARILATTGFLVISASSHLGHNMVYEHGVGVQDTHPLT